MIGPFSVDEIYVGDCITLMKQIPGGVIDHVFTDPPYGLDFGNYQTVYERNTDLILDGYVDIEPENYADFTRSWMRQVHRILKPKGTSMIVSGHTPLRDVLNIANELKFYTINHIIWAFDFGLRTGKRFVTSHSHVLFLAKDKNHFKFNPGKNYMDRQDVIYIRRELWKGKKKTPTRLPIALVMKLLKHSTDEGDLVLDPFMGSGTTAVASKRMNRRFLGFEIVEDYVKFSKERLKGTGKPLW